MNSSNVTSAKPKIGGAIYSAPLGTELPTDATSQLAEEYQSLGYVSDDGLTNENSTSFEEVKAWGGDVVDSSQTEKSDKFSYKLIEALKIEVLKEVYGAENVSGTLQTGIVIKVNSKELPEHVIVVDMIMKNGIQKRIVVPKAKVVEVGEIVYKDGEVVGYDTTLQAFPHEGDTHIEYIKGA